MSLFEGLVVVLLSVATAALARRLRFSPETHVQCWHCRSYADRSAIRWSGTKFNGHQVPLCDDCQPEAVPPTVPTLERVA
jgi:hypothetical protein